MFLCLCLVMMAQPSGINYNANHIELNGDDWGDLINNLTSQRRANRKFTIVHIGDSHVQPGIISDEVRRALQEAYGNGGRGLISPLAMAGTNEPRDYSLKASPSPVATSRLISSSRAAGMGFTGVAVRFGGSGTMLSIKGKHEGDDFYRITMYHSPGSEFDVWQNDKKLKAHATSSTATDYVLRNLADTANLRVSGSASLYGVRLLNSKRGVVVDCIGNNGATYRSYVGVDGFARQLRDLEPQLVIISLGTNEAYGRYTSLSSYIDQLLTSISRECPNVKFLLTTPLETMKKGGRMIQTGIAGVRDVIVNYGRSHHVPVWDFYRVGGGPGSANRWIKAHCMAGDHLHLTTEGYHQQGKLLATALMRLFSGEDDGSAIIDEPTQPATQQEDATDSEETEEGDDAWQRNSSTDN